MAILTALLVAALNVAYRGLAIMLLSGVVYHEFGFGPTLEYGTSVFVSILIAATFPGNGLSVTNE